MARDNARRAGVDDFIHLQERPVSEMSHSGKYGFVVTNPPYGERIGEAEDLPGIYRDLGEAMKRLDTWSFYLITAYEDAERGIGRRADKNRKIYNGMIKTRYLSYPGPKPPKRKENA